MYSQFIVLYIIILLNYSCLVKTTCFVWRVIQSFHKDSNIIVKFMRVIIFIFYFYSTIILLNNLVELFSLNYFKEHFFYNVFLKKYNDYNALEINFPSFGPLKKFNLAPEQIAMNPKKQSFHRFSRSHDRSERLNLS